MVKWFRSIPLVWALFALSSCATVAPTLPRRVALAITNTTVIDPESGRVLSQHSVFIEGDTLIAVEPAERRNFVASRTVDGRGKFLVPGFTDMHVHLFLPEPAAPTLNLLLANGVTSIREMSSDCWANAGANSGCIDEYQRLREAVRAGRTVGPEILGLTSTMVFGPSRMKLPDAAAQYITPRDAVQALTLISYLGTRGVDMIKTHDSIPLASFKALMAGAKRRRIPVGGHVPFAAGSLGAARMGYRSIEHARDLLYDCSGYGPSYRRREGAFADGVPTPHDRRASSG
jgi:imidazolonepropionase-like amidohydrolase